MGYIVDMRKRKPFSREEGTKSARLIVIAAEGRKTENIYFQRLKLEHEAQNVHVEILERGDNNSNPETVFQQISKYAKDYDIEEDDQLWVVVDRDRWKNVELASVAKKCSQKSNFHFCLSNPCFEIWLLLHIEGLEKYSEEEKERLSTNIKCEGGRTFLKKRLSELLGGYNEAKYDAGILIRTISDAIERAKVLDNCPKDRWPQNIGTRAYLLVESIMNL